MAGVLCRGETWTQQHSRSRPSKEKAEVEVARLRGRERRRPAGLQGLETRTGSVLTALCRTQPRRHLDLGLAASRTATCCRLSRQSVVLCYGGPRTRGRHPRASDLRSGRQASPRQPPSLQARPLLLSPRIPHLAGPHAPQRRLGIRLGSGHSSPARSPTSDTTFGSYLDH